MSEQTLSTRGQKNVPEGEAFDKLVEIFTNVYDKETNPDGIEFASFFSKIDVQPRHLTYGDGPFGTRALRAALSDFFNDYLHPFNKVQPQQLLVAAGVTSVLDLISFAVANPGDGILIGRPLYGSFLKDLSTRSEGKLVPVSSEGRDPMGEKMVEQYEKELLKQEKAGTKIAAVILASPHNPLGKCYTVDTLKAYMRFCQKYRIHFISDEVYAKSIYKTADNTHSVPFTSVLSIDTTSIIDANLVHILYGMSKDFCSNGLRAGVLLTQNNPAMIKCLKSIALFSWSASMAEEYWTQLLNDRPFLDYFFAENSKRLAEGYSVLTSFLKKHDIKWVEGSNAGFFIWVDFRGLLGKDIVVGNEEVETTSVERPSQVYRTSKKAKERDDWFFEKLVKARVFVASGNSFFSEEHGWYRITFSMPKEILEAGLERLGKVLEEVKREVGD
ncbi:MAG: hypothetical protein Q9219_000785 [cf. Caloplaca sp. 3 TL-2023]